MQYADKINKNGKSKLVNLLSRDTGFTLAEIITVIIILGVLTTLALPRLTGTIERTRATEGVQILTALLSAQKTYEFETGSYTADPDDLDVEITTASYFNIPPTVADPADPVANPIAEIRRTNAYRLGINEEGLITCTNVAPNDFTCAQAGY